MSQSRSPIMLASRAGSLSPPAPVAAPPLPAGRGPAYPAAGPAPAGPSALAEAVRQALKDAAQNRPGRVALHLAGGAAAHRRRVLKVLLQDAAMSGGGQVFETTTGELLLLGAAAGAAARVTQVLAGMAGMAGTAVPGTLWHLPDDAGPLVHWAAAAQLAGGPPVVALGPPADIAGLDQRIAALRPEALARRQAVLRLARGGNRVEGVVLHLSAALLAAEIGTLAADPDLFAHAEDRLATRLTTLMEDAALAAAPLLLLPLPRRGAPPPAPRAGLVGVLPLAEAANPAALLARRAQLAAGGWQLALGGISAAALRLLVPAALPADLLLLQWSPAMAQPGLADGLARIDPARLVLLGCDGPEALAWGSGQGISRFAGPHVEAMLAAARLANCPRAGECTARQCSERAGAVALAGRAGCGNPALLAAMLPADGFAALQQGGAAAAAAQAGLRRPGLGQTGLGQTGLGQTAADGLGLAATGLGRTAA
jgi:hypothetical protein